MRIASGSGKHHHAAAVSILLIVAVLVVGVAACDGDGASTYQLMISSASGGNVTSPGEGTFPYQAGTVVALVATSDDGYRFHSWTGDIQDIANPNTASTIITVDGNYAIVANFETEGEAGPGNGGNGGPAQP